MVALFFSVKVSEQTQSLTGKAAVNPGTVLVQVVPSASPYFLTNTSSKLTFRANTQGLAVYGIQLFIDFITDTTSAYSLVIPPESGLELISQELIDISGGKRLAFAVRPKTLNSSYVTQSYTDFATLYFVPSKAGSIVMNTSQELSHATKYNDPQNDQLQVVPQLVFEVRDPTSSQLTPTPTVQINSTTTVGLPSSGNPQVSIFLGILATVFFSVPLLFLARLKGE